MLLCGTALKKKSDRLSPPERRGQLIEATLVCLMREGMSGLSSRKICAQAQVSVGLLNHHFTSQEDLVAAAYEEISNHMRADKLTSPVTIEKYILIWCE